MTPRRRISRPKDRNSATDDSGLTVNTTFARPQEARESFWTSLVPVSRRTLLCPLRLILTQLQPHFDELRIRGVQSYPQDRRGLIVGGIAANVPSGQYRACLPLL
jgi:hypothetical protein